MNEKKRRQEETAYGDFYEDGLVQSATEMTGLTPTPPLTESEDESYADLAPDTDLNQRKSFGAEFLFYP